MIIFMMNDNNSNMQGDIRAVTSKKLEVPTATTTNKQ